MVLKDYLQVPCANRYIGFYSSRQASLATLHLYVDLINCSWSKLVMLPPKYIIDRINIVLSCCSISLRYFAVRLLFPLCPLLLKGLLFRHKCFINITKFIIIKYLIVFLFFSVFTYGSRSILNEAVADTQ